MQTKNLIHNFVYFTKTVNDSIDEYPDVDSILEQINKFKNQKENNEKLRDLNVKNINLNPSDYYNALSVIEDNLVDFKKYNLKEVLVVFNTMFEIDKVNKIYGDILGKKFSYDAVGVSNLINFIRLVAFDKEKRHVIENKKFIKKEDNIYEIYQELMGVVMKLKTIHHDIKSDIDFNIKTNYDELVDAISLCSNSGSFKRLFLADHKNAYSLLKILMKDKDIDIEKLRLYSDYLILNNMLKKEEYQIFGSIINSEKTNIDELEYLFNWYSNIKKFFISEGILDNLNEFLILDIDNINVLLDLKLEDLNKYLNIKRVDFEIHKDIDIYSIIHSIDYFMKKYLLNSDLSIEEILFKKEVVSDFLNYDGKFSITSKKNNKEIKEICGFVDDKNFIDNYEIYLAMYNKDPDNFIKRGGSFYKRHSKLIDSIKMDKTGIVNQKLLLIALKNGDIKDIEDIRDSLGQERSIKSDFINYLKVKEEINGINPSFEMVLDYVLKNIDRESIEGFIDNLYGYVYISDQYKKSKILNNFNESEYLSNLNSFKESLVNISKMTLNKIYDLLDGKKLPKGVGGSLIKNKTEEEFLKHRIKTKVRNFSSVRSLMEKSFETVSTLKPIFMMSPMSVPQFLGKGDMNFDVLIIDEASQMLPEYAISSIARCSQVIITGDSNQLPPMRHFFSNIEDEDDEVDIENYESILDLAENILDFKSYLQWHYRSKHPSLIQFSNKHFYENKLKTFPSAKEDDSLGVQFHYIENAITNDRNVNDMEAQKLVNVFASDIKRDPSKTYGLVSINQKQSERISELIEELEYVDVEFKNALEYNKGANKEKGETLFIKNLENVQGDERDVIYISIVFAKKEGDEILKQQFGSINRSYGWRFLNVLFSRAKYKMHIFSSILPHEIKTESAKNAKSLLALKNFLSYAKNGKETKIIHSGREPDSEFEIQVIKELNKKGFKCVPQVGMAGFFIDIGVIDPNNNEAFILGVECDGATYHSSKVAKDRDLLRQQILESYGWEIHRVWSTNWFKNRDAEIEKLINRLNKLKS